MALVGDVRAPVLDGADRHHLERVLRLRPGDPLTVADGAGWWRPCRFSDGEPEPTADAVAVPRPSPAVAVGLSPVRGDRPEWAVQKLTEVGVDRIVVLAAERSVVRWAGERATRHLARLVRIAREATMQSRRAWLPSVEGVLPVAEAAAEGGAVLADPGGRLPREGDRFVLCGPEGGWSDRERDLGADRVVLGPTVLRSETAAVVAGALVVGLRHGIVAPAYHPPTA